MSNQYNNQCNNHKISQADFIKNSLIMNSMKRFWYGIDESEILTNCEYTKSTLSRITNLFYQAVYVEDRTNILSRIEYLRNYNDNENNEDRDYQPENTEDLLLNSISSFGITVSSQGGNPKFLYEDYKLKEFFQHLAKNAIEVNFKIIRKNT